MVGIGLIVSVLQYECSVVSIRPLGEIPDQ